MSTSVYGGRVREPQIIRRSVIPADKQSSSLSDLAQAWSTFGEAKSVVSLDCPQQNNRSPRPNIIAIPGPPLAVDGPTLFEGITVSAQRGKVTQQYQVKMKLSNQLEAKLQKLESTAVSPPTKARPSKDPLSKMHRRTKPYTVHFDPKSTKGGEGMSDREVPRGPQLTWTGRPAKHGGSSGMPNTYQEEGPPLDSEKENLVEGVVLNETKELPIIGRTERGGSGEATLGQGTSGTQQSSPPPEVSRQMNAQTSPIQSALQKVSSAYADPLSLSPASNPNTAGSSPHRGANTQKHHSNTKAIFGPPVSFGKESAKPPDVHPRTRVPGSEYPHPVLGRPTRKTNWAATHHPHHGAASRHPPVSAQAPAIRKFELPPDTLTTLRSKIEQQKQAVQATAAKMSAMKPQPSSTTTEFYPLPEASTAASSFSSLSRPHPPLAPPPHHPPVATARYRSIDSADKDLSQQVKKRKIASAPPPRSYTGFSTVGTIPVSQTTSFPSGPSSSAYGGSVQWKPNLERVGQMTGGEPLSVRGSKASYASRSAVQPSSDRVRKLYQQLPASQRPAASTTSVITPSSWRVGKELTDRILRQETQSPPKPLVPSQSSYSESHSLPDISAEHDLSTASSVASLPPQRATSQPTVGLSFSVAQPTVGLSANVSQLLEDLEMSSQEGKEAQSEQDKNKPPLSRPKRYVPGTSSTAPKKPRFNCEPEYPTQRVRHYDQAEVRHYIQHKQEERRRRQQEARSAQERARQARQERLRELSQRQKRSLTTNLRQREKERAAYSRALASSAAAEVHIHVHDTSSLDSEAHLDEKRGVPAVTITPPRLHQAAHLSHTIATSPQSHATPDTITTSPRLSPHRGEAVTTPRLAVPPSTLSTYHFPPYTHTSPLHLQPSPLASLTGGTSPRTHLLESYSPPSPHTYSVRRTSPSLTPSPRERFPSPTSAHAHLSPQVEKLSPPPSRELRTTLAPLLRGTGDSKPTATSGVYRTREERIQALTLSALQLKERIAMETKRLTEGAYDTYRRSNSQSNSATPPRRHVQQQEDDEEEPTHYSELPGIHNVRTHAVLAEQARREEEAALRIQAAYRGYQVRRSLRWRLPSGQTLGGVRRGGDGGESESDDGGGGITEEEEEEEEESEPPVQPVSPPELPPSRSDPKQPSTQAPLLSGSQSCPVFQVPPSLSPWQQGGGDSHSVINVFTRQHEKLRETLAQMKTQKLAELRQIGEQSSSVSPTKVENPILPSAGAGVEGIGSDGSQVEPSLSIYTYTESFEPSSTKRQGEEGSPILEDFSHDSLGTRSQDHSITSSSPSSTHGGSSGVSTPVSILPPTTQPPTETTQEVSVITPPGSPSFVEMFSSETDRPKLPARPQASHQHRGSSGRLSPRSLELKLQAELNLLETVEESMRQITDLESVRAVSLAQQETVNLAQLLKSRQQTHEQEVQSLAVKAKREVEEAQKQFEKVHQDAVVTSEQIKQMRGEADAQVKNHMTKLARIQEESALAAQEASRQLAEARSSATIAVVEAAQQQIQAAHSMAVSVATAAAKEAVKTALSSKFQPEARGVSSEQPLQDSSANSYHSDFEPSSMQPDSLGDGSSVSDADVDQSQTPTATPPKHKPSSGHSSLEESLTPVATELEQQDGGEEEGDRTLLEEEEEEEEEDGDTSLLLSRTPSPELSFRELLPSESHRRSRRRLSLHGSDSDSRTSSPFLSRPRMPSADDLSPPSPSGEDSFFQFMNRMVKAYMREEELRAHHQSTLLQLREKALKERTQAELEWLTLKKQQLRNKGDDDLMPPLVSREKGLLKKLHHEQAEIRQLRDAQRVASYERRLMLLQQREISKIRRSAQYYREKIRTYGSHHHHHHHHHLEQSSSSPSPSLDETFSSQDLKESVPLEHSTVTPPSPSHATTFPTYSPSHTPHTSLPAQPVTEEDISSHAPQDDSRDLLVPTTAMDSSTHLELSRERTHGSVTTPKTPPSDSTTAQKLKKLASSNAEKYLTQHERWLLKRRHMAEEALRQQQELLEREQKLEREERQINQLIDKATETYQHRQDIRHERSRRKQLPKGRGARLEEEELSVGGEQGDQSGGAVDTVMDVSTPSRSADLQTSSVLEHIHTSSSVTEEISGETGLPADVSAAKLGAPSPKSGPTTSRILTEYADDTFESLEGTPTHPASSHLPIIASTPAQPPASGEDFSLSESLKDSISEPMTTSEGSIIESRIRVLKERLRQRKEEVKRVQSEQKRKKKAILRQQEEQLQKKLEAVESKLSQSRRTADTSSTTSQSTSVSPSPPPSDKGTKLDSILPPFNEGATQGLPPSTRGTIAKQPEVRPGTHDLVEAAAADSAQEYSYTTLVDTATKSTTTATSISISAVSVTEDIELPAEPAEVDEECPTPPPSREESGGEEGLELPPIREGSLDIAEDVLEKLEDSAKRDLSETHTVPTSEVLVEPSYTETFEKPSETLDVGTPAALSALESKEADPVQKRPPDEAEDFSDDDFKSTLSSEHALEEFHPGQRVLVGKKMSGTVCFIGQTHFSKGLWIGVELDLPKGRNDGSIDEYQYFSCEPNHGIFAPPNKVSVMVVEPGEEESQAESSVTEEIASSGTSMSDDLVQEREEKALPASVEKGDQRVASSPTSAPHLSYSADFETPSELEQPVGGTTTMEETHETTQIEQQALAVEDAVPEEITEASEATEPSAECAPLEPLPAPPTEVVESPFDRPESLPFSFEITQRSTSATPTPAPPPEFAEGASRESSQEPFPTEPDDHRPSSEVIADELAQELSNEAFVTMSRIWRTKRPVRKHPEVVVQKDKEVPLTLEDKADKITDQILTLLLQTETRLMHNIHAAKKTRTPPPEAVKLDPVSPKKRGALRPPTQLIIPSHNIIESTTPPISPPSPYHSTTPLPPGEFSPPSSPPRHLSQPSAARVAAGEKTPFFTGHPEPGSATLSRSASIAVPGLERTTSTESISQLLDSMKLTTAQCLVPSERECVDRVVAHAWNAVMDVGLDHIHSVSFECHQEVLSLFADARELSKDEDRCRGAYLRLVYMLAIETVRQLHPVREPRPVWGKRCAVGTLGTPQQKEVTLELVQKKVYAALMCGQIPLQMPGVRFLHGLKRPGGKEIDFVDSILIKELREEEPTWVDYSKDEVTIEKKTADAILDTLLLETAQILSTIEKKRRTKRVQCV